MHGSCSCSCKRNKSAPVFLSFLLPSVSLLYSILLPNLANTTVLDDGTGEPIRLISIGDSSCYSIAAGPPFSWLYVRKVCILCIALSSSLYKIKPYTKHNMYQDSTYVILYHKLLLDSQLSMHQHYNTSQIFQKSKQKVVNKLQWLRTITQQS